MDFIDRSLLDSLPNPPTMEEIDFADSLMPPLKREFEQTQSPDGLPDLDGKGESIRVAFKKWEYRRAYSEMSLLDSLKAPGFCFEKGAAYLFMTKGDIDALSFLKSIIRQTKIMSLIISTWCAENKDILQLKKWIDDGRIGKLDFILGELYVSGQRRYDAESFKAVFKDYTNVTVTVARNHSKVMAGRGEDFDFVILSSANINTNPRIENTTIFIPEDGEMLSFYESFFKSVRTMRR